MEGEHPDLSRKREAIERMKKLPSKKIGGITFYYDKSGSFDDKGKHTNDTIVYMINSMLGTVGKLTFGEAADLRDLLKDVTSK